MTTLPPFLRQVEFGTPVHPMALGGETRWWFTSGATAALWHLLRNASGRKWPLLAMRAATSARLAADQVEWTPEIAGFLHAHGLSSPLHFVAQLGSPGLFRKYIVINPDDSGGGWVLKYSLTEASRASIENEFGILGYVAPHLPAHVQVARPIAFATGEGYAVSLQGACMGWQQRAHQHWTPSHEQFCLTIGSLRANDGTFAGSISERERIRERLALRPQSAQHATRCGRLLDHACSRLSPDQVPAVLAHRDFTPWNVAAGKALSVVDWEWADRRWMPLHDAFHYHLFPELLAGRLDGLSWSTRSSWHGTVERLAVLLKAPGPLHVYAAWYLYDLYLFYLDAIDREPPKTFDDPLIARIALIADRWLAQWPAPEPIHFHQPHSIFL